MNGIAPVTTKFATFVYHNMKYLLNRNFVGFIQYLVWFFKSLIEDVTLLIFFPNSSDELLNEMSLRSDGVEVMLIIVKQKKFGKLYNIEKSTTGDTYFRTRFPSEDPILRFLCAIGLATAKYLSNVSTSVM